MSTTEPTKSMHKVRIVQVTRVERSIIIDVEGDTPEDAVDMQSSAESPGADDPRWVVERDTLENETVETV